MFGGTSEEMKVRHLAATVHCPMCGHDFAVCLHDYDGMSAVEPPGNVFGGARASLERGNAILDALVVDGRDGNRVVNGGGTSLQGSYLRPS